MHPSPKAALLAAMTLLLPACGGGGGGGGQPAGDPPTINAEPLDVAVIAGETATFAVNATGDLPLTYQWRRDGVAIPGATLQAYTTPATALGDHGAGFSVLVRNPAGERESRRAVLSVSAAPVGPTITAQPVGVTVLEGETATFSVTATGTAPLTYFWRRNGQYIAGANGTSYTTPPTTAADHGSTYGVVVNNEVDAVASSAAILVVVVPAVAPVITLEPANVSVAVGQTATFRVEATGTAPLTYQWYRGTGPIAGATGPSYSLVVNRGDTGSTYHVVVGNQVGEATSRNALLTVLF